MTTADSALCDAAERRGLHVANPLDATATGSGSTTEIDQASIAAAGE